MAERTTDDILRDVAALVAGLQVPVSLMSPKAALGTGFEAWQRLRDDMTGGHSRGWLSIDLDPYVANLRTALTDDGIREQVLQEARDDADLAT